MPVRGSRPRIALATCVNLPEPDLDFRPLARALQERDCDVDNVAWDSDPVSREYDAYVLRSTWNYYRAPERFLRWIDERASTSRLINPRDIVHWNLDKRYLTDLNHDGVPIVETVWFDPGQAADALADVSRRRGWDRFVVKPVISAASFGTRSFGSHELSAAIDFLAGHLSSRSMMVQPFMSSVENVGEKSIVWIDGQVTHAWIKRPRFAGDHESAQPTPDISDEDRAVVERALNRFRGEALYARVDLMYDSLGKPCLSELELIEPSLYFDFSPLALSRFADAVVRRSA